MVERSRRLPAAMQVFLVALALLASCSSAQRVQDEEIFHCPDDWVLHGESCYRFFNIKHSWMKAAKICKRFGSELLLVDSYVENNFTQHLAHLQLDHPTSSYWLGAVALNDLNTNTLESAGGDHVSLYSGFWSQGQPRVQNGECVRAKLGDQKQAWELSTCESLLPFMCKAVACPMGSILCSNGKCVNEAFLCDGQNDCGDMSDEMNCENRCEFYMKSSGDSIESPNYPNKYGPNMDCQWTLEGPVGHNIVLQFYEFDTEKNFDTVQILIGGRTPDSAVPIATLSGRQDLSSRLFVSASNFMILKFKSDAAAEKRGFRASWKTEPQSCGGEFIASPNPQVLASPNYPSMDCPGGLECLYELKTQQGNVITIQITDFDMEKDNDYILVRDGSSPSSRVLARLTGKQDENPKFIISTGPTMYLYLRTSFGNSGKGFQIRYYSGCSVTLEALKGDVTSPAYGISNYPNNQECLYLIRRPGGGRLSLKFQDFVVSDKDTVQVYDGAERTQAIRLHPGQGFSAANPPSMTLTADSGTMLLRFSSDPLRNAKGWSAKFSADCHQLRIGEGAIASSRETAFDSVITYSCPKGHEFANNKSTIVTKCNLGGMWSVDYIPACQEVYCGPVPQIDNGFSIGATNVSFLGQATYQCYAGFAFPSGAPVETVTCLETGQWQSLPECLASQCPPLPDTPNIVRNLLNGGGRSYGTVVRLECEEGYVRTGHPVIHCMSNGSWSGEVPTCAKKKCSQFPEIVNGFVTDVTREYYFGDEARVQCHRGFRLVGSPLIKCGAENGFIDLPTCEDMDECTTAQCDAASTECMNSPGAFSCKCKPGFVPNLNCRPVGDLGVSDGGIPDDAITVSGTIPGYEKNSVRLNSQPGWCGTIPVPGKNWVMVDLRVPTVVRGLRTQPVALEDGNLAYSTSIILQYSNNLTEAFQNYVSASGSPVEFHITSGAPLSALNLPEPIEARYIRLNIANFQSAPCLKFELMGCARQDCIDINECEDNQGGCSHRCVNSPGSFSCACDVGYNLFVNETTDGFTIEESETGLRDGDVYRLNKTCVPKMCPKLESPPHGLLLDTREMHHFMDVVQFQCDYGYIMQGSDTLECTNTGEWNGTVPECTPALCHPLKVDGVSVIYDDPESIMVPLGQNVSFACNEDGKPLRNTATADFRQCVYDPKEGLPDYWLSGVQPECERRDCGIPAETPGAAYGFTADTKYESTFYFGCQETFTFNGQTSRNDNVVRCDANGNWDFGDLRCEGPVCSDPGHPPDGRQIATSYEQGSKIHFACDRPGYIPITDEPLTCVNEPGCKVVKPIGITSGKIPDSAFNVSSERTNYEAHNIRLNSATGWCGKEGPFTYVTVDLGSVHYIKVILLKGVITNDVVGRPTEIRFFYKVEENADFMIYFPNFNLTKRDPGNYGELAMIKLPVFVEARFIVLAIISHDKNPCLKFELMGCEAEPEEVNLLGFDSTYPTCVDNMPPVFTNCPVKPIVVEKGPNGILPVDFVAPVAEDNSGIILRTEVKPAGFQTPMYIFEDTRVGYFAYDIDGNVAICWVNITVPDDTPPFIACPQSYVIELVDEQETYTVNFNSSLTLANVQASDNHDENVKLSVYPGEAVIRVGDYQNVTVTATDAAGNSAMCSFQVAVKASACVDWELKRPSNGQLTCNNDPRRGMVCTAVCEAGFRFTDNMPAKEFVCTANDGLWYPNPIVPDCVSEDTEQASYDTVAEISYRSNGAVVASCLEHYETHVQQFAAELNELHSSSCHAATRVPIKVELVDVGMKLLQENMVNTRLVLRISHTTPQQRIYELCGNVLSLIYDLTLPSASSEIEKILNMPSVGSSCPPLRALTSNVTKGFTCSSGEVLNTETSVIPRCLHCPAGSFAKAMEDQCTPCPMGFYQDMSRQGSCKQCPAGKYTRHNGSKSLDDCIPVCGYGTYSPTGLVPCLNCPQHTYSVEPPVDGFRECQSCPPNTFTFMAGAVSQQQCRQMCAPGTYSDNGLEPCNPCPRNFYQPMQGKMTCLECPSEKRTINEGSTSEGECQDIECTENICQNGGLCLSRHHQIQCYCAAGFSGKFCEIDINECDSTPCYNGGKCIDKPQSYECECLPGYSGLQCQDEESDCVPGACPDRAMCKDNPGIGNFECLCRSGYTGADCSVTVDPCIERGNPCNNSGICTPLQQGKFQCECMPGWEGRLCETNTDDCAEMPCLLGAPCTDLINDFKCDCPPGFTGKRCHLKVDLCESKPCANGICVDKFFEHECICYEGFTGESCDINIDECSENPCEHGGLCIDQVNGYKCSCETGFTGKNCQHMVDYCASDPCENAATCTNTLDGFVCECRPGFVGLQCEASTDECISSPCNAVGTEECIDLDNMFECKCHTGFVGEFCETNIDECEFNPCLNGGTCIDGVADYTCECERGWSGKRCEQDVGGCDENPCLNDAQCIDLFEDFFCVCPSGTDGKMCQVSPERCVGNPCMNGAQCQDFGSGLNCTCSEDYTGVGCQYEFDACAEGVCKNGATCIDHGEGYQCLCAPGYEGRHCDVDIVDCTPSACPPGATCIDLTNDFYCRCPFNLTGEDCRKVINFDYDLYINDESKTSSASLATPFDLMEAKAFTLALWVQFTQADSKGIVFTLFSVSNPFIPENKRVLLQATDSSMIIELVPSLKEVISYRPNIPINDGQWHHIAVIWDGTEGVLTLTTDAVVVAQVTGFGQGRTMPNYGWITLGAVPREFASYSDVRGFHGRIARLNVWNRAIDYRIDVPKMARSCMKSPVLFEGLLLRWAGYDRVEGNVERVGPSNCGQHICPPGYSGDCTVLQRDKTPPRVDHCPGHIWVITRNGSAVVNWDRPRFTDNIGIEKTVEKSGYFPGQAFALGTYHIATVAYDAAGNSATCSFNVYVLEEFCEDLEDPIGGIQRCSNWGPGGRFKVCSIECNPGLKFSTEVPDFYTCGAEGFWRPTEDPTIPLVYPACSKATPAQRVFKINMQFPSSVICNAAGQNVLSERIRVALMKLNREWNFCTESESSTGNCKGLDVGVDCSRRTRISKRDARSRRQAAAASDASQPEAEDAYDVVITFPAINDPVLNSNTNEQASVLQLIQSIILEDDQFDVRDALPNVVPDPASLNLQSDYSCPIGKVVVGSDCVDCSPGTYYDRVTEKCEMCEAGTFSDEVGQVACKPCPETNGRQGVTRSRGSRSLEQCHERCSAGKYYDEKSEVCRPCGYGFYQPDEGSFMCQRCDRGLTTSTMEAVSADECREECESGLQLSVGGGCEVCPRGTFRTKGVHPACIKCPRDRTTNNPGASSPEECALPICLAGTFLSEVDSVYECIPCPRGTFQPEAMQTSCIKCTESTSTKGTGSTSPDECTNPCQVLGEEVLCDANADCLYLADEDDYVCECKDGFNKTDSGECIDTCKDYCFHDGVCKKTDRGLPYCECVGSFTGKQCQNKTFFAYIAGGMAGFVVFVIILVLLVWMICLRSTKKQDPKKLLPPPTLDPAGSQEMLMHCEHPQDQSYQGYPLHPRLRFPGSFPVLPPHPTSPSPRLEQPVHRMPIPCPPPMPPVIPGFSIIPNPSVVPSSSVLPITTGTSNTSITSSPPPTTVNSSASSSTQEFTSTPASTSCQTTTLNNMPNSIESSRARYENIDVYRQSPKFSDSLTVNRASSCEKLIDSSASEASGDRRPRTSSECLSDSAPSRPNKQLESNGNLRKIRSRSLEDDYHDDAVRLVSFNWTVGSNPCNVNPLQQADGDRARRSQLERIARISNSSWASDSTVVESYDL